MAKKKNEITIRSSAAEYLTFVASARESKDSFEIRYEDENIWLTQKLMATLYDVETHKINYHIKKIFADSELEESSVIRKFRITAHDGKIYNTNHYNLQMVIAIGFKVNSERAVQFRKWVNQIAKDYTIKGWVMDDERLKNGSYLTDKYFEEQLARIREIRASERKFYQKDAPDGKIKITDVSVAKNYLSEFELNQLNRMVSSYLDFAENMTQRKIPLTMQDWEFRLNSFIEMFEYGLLKDAGKVSAAIAKLHAESEFEKYRIIQDRLFLSDYNKYLIELEEQAKSSDVDKKDQ